MIYMASWVNNYHRKEHGRSAVNGPEDFRRMWSWLLDPTGRRRIKSMRASGRISAKT